MKQTARLTFRWLTIIVVALPGLCADYGHTDRLTDQADAIVIGDLQSGQQTGHSLSFTLLIIQTIKGELAPGMTPTITAATKLSVTRSLRGHYGLWFLKKRSGMWALLPIISGGAALETSGFFPLSRRGPPFTAVPPVTTHDHIVSLLAAAVQNYSDASQLFYLAYGLSGIDRGALVPTIYRTLRTNSDPEIKFIGLTGVWAIDHDITAFAEIADGIDLVPRLHTSSLVGNLVCGTRNPDPRVILYLGAIAASSNADLQRCAAMALDFIHTRDTLPYLARLLDSGDGKTREFAMQGFSRFVDNLPIQSPRNITDGTSLISQGPTPYRTLETDKYSLSRQWLGAAKEPEYLHFWKSWWAATKDRLSAKVP